MGWLGVERLNGDDKRMEHDKNGMAGAVAWDLDDVGRISRGRG